MPSTTVEYGRNFILKINTVQIGNLVSNGLSQSRDKRETTTKDSADNEENEVTIKRRTISFNGLFTEAAISGGGITTMQNALDNGTVLLCREGNTTPGTHYWEASGRFTKLDFEAPHDNNVTFTGEIAITGAVTFGTN